MSEDLVHAVVDPNSLIRLHVPFEDAERSPIGGDAQAGLAFPQRLLGAFALRHIEIDANNAICPDGGMRAQPALRAIGHAKPILVLVARSALLHRLLLDIACL